MTATKKLLAALATLTMHIVRIGKDQSSNDLVLEDIAKEVNTEALETHRRIKIYCRVIVGFGIDIPKGSIPIFSVDSEEEAYRLLMMTCPMSLSHERIATDLMHGNLSSIEQHLKNGHVMLHGQKGGRHA